MLKFLLKGALLVGAAGLILEGVKKLTEDNKKADDDLMLDDDHYEDEPETSKADETKVDKKDEEEALPAIAPDGVVKPLEEAKEPEEVESVPAIAPVQEDLPAPEGQEQPAQEAKDAETVQAPAKEDSEPKPEENTAE